MNGEAHLDFLCVICLFLTSWTENLTLRCVSVPSPKCKKSFLRKQYLKTHLIRHNADLTWECALCSKVFVSEDDLDKHRSSYHKKGKRLGSEWDPIDVTP